jgi:PadR family transcriptional regulator
MTDGPQRITKPLLAVLRVLKDREMHGWAISEEAGMERPTIYVLMKRLESWGWVTSRWEDNPGGVNRPRRCYYRFTEKGAEAAGLLTRQR